MKEITWWHVILINCRQQVSLWEREKKTPLDSKPYLETKTLLKYI